MNKQPKKPTVHKKAGDSNQLEQHINELTADLQRVQADFINYKRREAENDEFRRAQAKAEVIRTLMPFIDNIDRALTHAPADLKDHDFVKGVAGVARQLNEFLSKLGIERIKTVGQDFNPELMDAVAIEEGGEAGKEVVTEELQSGYILGDVVIRHAVVKVKKG
jgi:molecular chaperone GrpE